MIELPADLGERLASAPAVAVARAALSGGDVWIVGGAVRDAALGREVTDVDLAVRRGREERVARAIGKEGNAHAFELSEEFATWRVTARAGDWRIDVTALRDGGIEADLAKRDFTVNAVAIPLRGGAPVDPHAGIDDLGAGRLRAVSPETFEADPLRLLRAARLSAGLGLAPDEATLELARRFASRAADPAAERQFAELRGIVAGPAPLRGIELMDELAVTPVVLPELDALRGVIQNPNHHLDVHGHTMEVLANLLEVEGDLERFAGERATEVGELLAEPLADELDRRGALRLATLFHDVGKPATRAERGAYVTFIGHDEKGAEIVAGICRRLRTSRKLSAHLQQLTRHHLRLGFLVHRGTLDRRVIYEYLASTEPVAVDVTLLTVADRLSARGEGELAKPEMIEAHLELARRMIGFALDWRRDPPRAPVSGEELARELSIEGPRLGDLLEELRAAAYAGEVADRDSALKLARELSG